MQAPLDYHQVQAWPEARAYMFQACPRAAARGATARLCFFCHCSLTAPTLVSVACLNQCTARWADCGEAGMGKALCQLARTALARAGIAPRSPSMFAHIVPPCSRATLLCAYVSQPYMRDAERPCDWHGLRLHQWAQRPDGQSAISSNDPTGLPAPRLANLEAVVGWRQSKAGSRPRGF